MNKFISSARLELPSRQKGAVLVIGMALLIIITLFALAAIRGITMQERIAGGLYDRELAFTAAESTLRWAERQYINRNEGTDPKELTLKVYGDDPCPGSPPNTQECFKDLRSLVDLETFGFEKVPFSEFKTGSGDNLASAADAPLYLAVMLEEGGECGEAARINAVGVGRSPNTVVLLESIVCRP